LAESYLEIPYEDLLERPYAFAARMARFAGVSPADAEIEQAVSFVERPQTRSGVIIPASSMRRPPVRPLERETLACNTRSR
jgi:hypothetical protein